jgi:nucleoside phosphorylase
MEGAAMFALAEALELEVTEIRAISNRVGESFAKWRIEEALNALAEVLVKIEKEL